MLARRALTAAVAGAFVTSFVGDVDAAPRKRGQISKQLAKKRDVPHKNPFGDMPSGPLQMVVSIDHQHVTLYSNGVRVTQSRVSTGTASNPTPTGVFSVIEKDRWHRSNLYGNAPMFYMQRLTWSGVAMHEGILPGYAASHGCIRLPTDFASRLWVATRLGVRVVIARNDPVPVDFSHPTLFNPRQKPVADQVSDIQTLEGLRSTVAAEDAGSRARLTAFAQATANDAGTVRDVADQPPALPKTESAVDSATEATGPVAPASAGEAAAPGMAQSTESIEAAPPTAAAPIERDTIASTPATTVPAPVSTPTAAAEPAPDAAPADVSGEPEKREPVGAEPNKPTPPRNRANEPVKKAGQVAVFISKREKKIFVRQGFVPVFEMPVEIADPDQPLGTHVFTALEVADGGGHMRWNAISMPPERARPAVAKGNKKNPQPGPVETKAPSTAAQALDRIKIPPEALERISELLIPGSSLVISDHGLGPETGRYTEFIVVTR